MNLPEQIIDSLKRDVYCRLGRSTIAGVGVIAIKFIPKGVNPFMEIRGSSFIAIPTTAINHDPDIPLSVKKLVRDMCPEEDGKYWFPDYSLNELGIGYYINHSETPNMAESDGDFATIRDVDEGEELTVNYRTYGELNLD